MITTLIGFASAFVSGFFAGRLVERKLILRRLRLDADAIQARLAKLQADHEKLETNIEAMERDQMRVAKSLREGLHSKN